LYGYPKICANENAPYIDHVSKLYRSRPGAGRTEREEEVRPRSESLWEPERLEEVSAVQMLDLLAQDLAARGAGAPAPAMMILRRRLVEMEEVQDQARTAVEQLTEAVEKLRAPALRLGTLLQRLAKGRALV